MVNASVTGSALNQIPLVNSTQILTASAQAPMTSVVATTPVVTASTPVMASTPIVTASTPIVAGSTPVMASSVQQVVTSSVPVAQPVMTTSVQPPQQGYGTSNFSTTVYSNPVVEDDYRLGRGILDDFRPSAYKSQVAGVGTTTGLATTGVATTGVAVSTPGVTVGASNLNDFL